MAQLDLSQSGTQSLVYSTFLGGSDDGVADGIAVDANGNAVVTGVTYSADFPITDDAFETVRASGDSDGFLTQLNSTGTALLYSTFLGGSCANGDFASGITLDSAGSPYVVGSTCSSDFPTLPSDAYQTTLGGAQNAFVTKMTLATSVVSVQVSPQNPTVITGRTQEFSATGTLSNGNTQDVTANATWSTSDPSVLTISNLPHAQGFSLAGNTGSATVTADLGTVTASTSVTVVNAPTPPVITSATPTSGIGNTQVTITGSGFGATQGTGYVYVGTALGVVSGWQDGQIVATVAPGSASGVVQVTQGGQQSNSIAFTVNSPTVTGIQPTNGVAATLVTINGTGFGSPQGNGQVQLGSMNGIVTSWSDIQIVATVATGATSGNAQVLQNGTWSNALPFTVNTPKS